MKHVATLLACAALGLAPGARAQTAYVAGSNNQFGTLNIATGQFTQTGTLANALDGLGFTSNGMLYGVDANSELYRVNPANGAETDLGSTSAEYAYTSTASGTLVYGLSGDTSARFFSVDPTQSPLYNGVTDLNTNTGINVDGLFAPVGNALYATGYGSGTGDPILYKLTTSGTVTTLGATNAATAFGAGVYTDGTLYGFNSNGSAYALNTSTGAATLTHFYNIGDGTIFAAAPAPDMAPAPEPSAWLTFAVGVFSLSVLTLRARQRSVTARMSMLERRS